MSDAAGRLEQLEQLTKKFHDYVPLNRAMGIEIVETGDGFGRMRLPWDDRWLGDPDAGLVHGGVLTVLLDATCGVAAFLALERPSIIATLDLRVDHLRAAIRGRELRASAQTVRRTRQVLFVRGTVDQGDPESPIATATATFAVTA